MSTVVRMVASFIAGVVFGLRALGCCAGLEARETGRCLACGRAVKPIRVGLS